MLRIEIEEAKPQHTIRTTKTPNRFVSRRFLSKTIPFFSMRSKYELWHLNMVTHFNLHTFSLSNKSILSKREKTLFIPINLKRKSNSNKIWINLRMKMNQMIEKKEQIKQVIKNQNRSIYFFTQFEQQRNHNIVKWTTSNGISIVWCTFDGVADASSHRINEQCTNTWHSLVISTF